MTIPQRFILVDDNEADNVYHEIMIRRAGFTGEVRVFESGAEALAGAQDKGAFTGNAEIHDDAPEKSFRRRMFA